MRPWACLCTGQIGGNKTELILSGQKFNGATNITTPRYEAVINTLLLNVGDHNLKIIDDMGKVEKRSNKHQRRNPHRNLYEARHRLGQRWIYTDLPRYTRVTNLNTFLMRLIACRVSGYYQAIFFYIGDKVSGNRRRASCKYRGRVSSCGSCISSNTIWWRHAT